MPAAPLRSSTEPTLTGNRSISLSSPPAIPILLPGEASLSVLKVYGVFLPLITESRLELGRLGRGAKLIDTYPLIGTLVDYVTGKERGGIGPIEGIRETGEAEERDGGAVVEVVGVESGQRLDRRRLWRSWTRR